MDSGPEAAGERAAAAPVGREPATWPDVERACAILTRTRPDDAEEVFRRSREALRVAVPAARWTALVCRDRDGRPAVASGDDVLADLVAAEPDHGGALARVFAADAEPVTELHLARPEPGAHATELGVGSLLVLCPPALPTERVGTADGTDASWPLALVLAAPGRAAFGAAAQAAARVAALQVGLLLVAARRVGGLHAALESRDLIGQAKGIVMQRDGVDADTAFDKLVVASQYANLKLHAVARWLVEETAQERNVALGEQP
ncbi:GAF and ANTAR domain-containing protein [Actinomycetospora chlora]|uniref:GAF and ANTAR domain-containing protein n=1 Tax=Actinomycetospora chlora TaxID=663608 RepID=A0ABP9CB11_9PSEU